MVRHGIQGDTFDQYCWVEGTYTRRRKLGKERKSINYYSTK